MEGTINLGLKTYFQEMKVLFQEHNDLNSLTELLGEKEFTETRPYLYRRKLNPRDKRFKYIELVYASPERVSKICWGIDISLSELRRYFDFPIFHYAPHGGATLIGFLNPEGKFTGFETIYPGEVKEKNGRYELISENGEFEVKDDLELSSVSYLIDRMLK
jgi:hypothetical protein